VVSSKKRLITSANLRLARSKLKKAFPRRAITPTQLRAALKKLKPGRKTGRITAAMLKSRNFNKLVEYYWKNNGAKSGANFENAWNAAREKAMRVTELQMNVLKSPPKNSTVRQVAPVARPVPITLVKRLKENLKKVKIKMVNVPVQAKARPKVMGNKGRMVYADLYYSLANLKRIAANRRRNITGLRSKEDIARKIFS
jgi:hypothetical protein